MLARDVEVDVSLFQNILDGRRVNTFSWRKIIP